jgi:predicted AlkP superfamily phosphohydrolase/phosphomutase
VIRRLFGRSAPRCIVIALDGVAASAFGAWGHEVLPFIAALGDRGTVARIRSPVPPLSAVAWASFATASNPGRHGVFGFTLPDTEYRVTFASSHSLRLPTLWDRAAIDGLRSVVVNLPGTYPARAMNGSLVAGFVAPSLARACHPPALADRLAAGGYRLDVDVRLADRDEPAFCAEVERATHARIEAMRWMLDEESWALAILSFTEPDRILHARHPSPVDDSRAGMTYRRVLTQVDDFVRELAQRYSDATMLVVSDHGFAPLQHHFNLNAWLRERDYLLASEIEAIDRRTVAFALDAGRVYVNTDGRFARGGIDPESARQTSESIARELIDIRTSDGSRPIASVVHRRDAYSGPLTQTGPNLVCLPAPGWELKASMRLPAVSGADRLRGRHTDDDALLVSSQPTSRPADGASLHDVGATVLSVLGIHADDVDGRSLL